MNLQGAWKRKPDLASKEKKQDDSEHMVVTETSERIVTKKKITTEERIGASEIQSLIPSDKPVILLDIMHIIYFEKFSFEDCFFATTNRVLEGVQSSQNHQVLENLPFDLRTFNPRKEYVSKVVEFSELTGDFEFLSVEEIELIALLMEFHHPDLSTFLEKFPSKRFKKFRFELKPMEKDEDGEEFGEWITPENIQEQVFGADDDVSFREIQDIEKCRFLLTQDHGVRNMCMFLKLPLIHAKSPSSQHELFMSKQGLKLCGSCHHLVTRRDRVYCTLCGAHNLKNRDSEISQTKGRILYFDPEEKVSLKGLIYPIPSRRSGKDARNPILRDDQNYKGRDKRKHEGILNRKKVKVIRKMTEDVETFGPTFKKSRRKKVKDKHFYSGFKQMKRKVNKRKKKGRKININFSKKV